MEFEIKGIRRNKSEYEYTIRGDNDFYLADLFPYMTHISKRSKNYKLIIDINNLKNAEIVDNRNSKHIRATMRLEDTLSPSFKKLLISDNLNNPVGKQMIDKFARSIEDPRIIEKIKSNQTTPK